jgi:hypothetical protein
MELESLYPFIEFINSEYIDPHLEKIFIDLIWDNNLIFDIDNIPPDDIDLILILNLDELIIIKDPYIYDIPSISPPENSYSNDKILMDESILKDL